MSKAKAPRVHREWFNMLVKTKCPDCGTRNTTVYSWGEYVRAKYRAVRYFCDSPECHTPIVEALKQHQRECGCQFELVGKNCQVPSYLQDRLLEINLQHDMQAQYCGIE